MHGGTSPSANKYYVGCMWGDRVAFTMTGMSASNFIGAARIRLFQVKSQGVSINDMFATLEDGAVLVDLQAQSGNGAMWVDGVRGNFDGMDGIILDHNSPPRSAISGPYIGVYDSLAGVRTMMSAPAIFPLASTTPAINGELDIEATSNTTLTFKYKGSDGVVRSGTITLT